MIATNGMPTILLSIVGAVVRWALTLVAGLILGALAKYALLSTEQVQAIMASNEFLALTVLITTALGTVLWSIYQKYRGHFKLLVALDLPPGSTVQDVKDVVSVTPVAQIVSPSKDLTPLEPLKPLLLAALLLPAFLFTACTQSMDTGVNLTYGSQGGATYGVSLNNRSRPTPPVTGYEK